MAGGVAPSFEMETAPPPFPPPPLQPATGTTADDVDEDDDDDEEKHVRMADGGVLLTDTLKSMGADTVISIGFPGEVTARRRKSL